MAGTEDFFGLNTLAADPYHIRASNKLQRLQSLDQILQQQTQGPETAATRVRGPQGGPMRAQGFDGGEISGTMPSTGTNMMGGGNPFMSALANLFMNRGRGGGYTPNGRAPGLMSYSRGESDPDPGPGGGGEGGGGTGGGGESRPPQPGPDVCPGGSEWVPSVNGGAEHGGTGGYWRCVGGAQEGAPPGGGGSGSSGGSGGGGGYRGGGGRGGYASNPDAVGNINFSGNYTDDTIPEDLRYLRSILGSYLGNRLGDYNPAAPFPLGIQNSPYMPQAASAGYAGASDAANWLGMGGNSLSDLLNFNVDAPNLSGLQGVLGSIINRGGASSFDPQMIWNALTNGQNSVNQYGAAASGAADRSQGAFGNAYQMAQPYFQHSGNILNETLDPMRGLMANGGAPDITSALNAIKTQSMGNLEDTLAQIRETYGAQGLGASSDVNEALARGASRGIADMNAQQTQLQAQVMNDAANRRIAATSPFLGASAQAGNIGNNIIGAGSMLGGGALSSAGMYNNIAGTLGNYSLGAAGSQLNTLSSLAGLQNSGMDRILSALPIGLQMANNPAQLALASAGIRSNAAGMLPGYAGTAGQAGSGLASILSNLAQLDSSVAGNNLNLKYQDWVRSTTNPFLNIAAGYATGFPPNAPVVPGNSGSAWGALGTIGGALMGALPWASWLSDRDLKEDVQEVKPITSRLKELPITTWRYKGDATRHIGPMAQDWKETMGVGDGHTIALPDVLGVILGSLQEMAHA